MEQFIRKHERSIQGILSGWDRLVFRGTYRILSVVSGMMSYLSRVGVLLKDFSDHAEAMTKRLMTASLAAAEMSGRPVIYLASSKESKEEVALEVLKKNPVEMGLVCVLRCVEPCLSFYIQRERAAKKLDLRVGQRKCLHLYHYYLDPDFGLMNARIQTWFPFSIQVCLNGREWLGRQLERHGITHTRYDNSFIWIDGFKRAQSLMDGLLTLNWPNYLDGIADKLNPDREAMFEASPLQYYWSAYQTEWATDVCFRSTEALASIYPQLVWGAMTSFSTPDVMRFLGRRSNCRFSGEVTSDFKNRPEGVRVKHRVNGNSLKMYDKGGTILRAECTINRPRDLKTYRAAENNPEGKKKWLPMRKGIADLHRRAQVSQMANGRYLDALAALQTDMRLEELLAPVGRPATRNGKRVRALRLWTREDQALLEAINRPEFLLGGIHNRDLASILYPDRLSDDKARRRASARVSYRLRLLRMHGLISKLPNTRRYRITARGQQIASACLMSQRLTLEQIAKAVA